MTWQRPAAILTAALLCACAPAQSSPPSDAASPATFSETAEPSSSPPEGAELETLGSVERPLEAGTYRMDLSARGGADIFPTFLITVPEGWTSSGGWALSRTTGGDAVAVTFWDVSEVYGHPCQWSGTQLQPGEGVDDLVAALLEVPMRNPTVPVEVEVGGHSGMYLEWSVPSDLAFDEQENFPDCDGDGAGHYDFRSWTGKGWASTRYHQAAGQVDRLWILDVGGARLVIDAYSMPEATDAEIVELTDVVNSIRFDE